MVGGKRDGDEESGAGAVGGWLWGPWSRAGLGVTLATAIADQAHKWWMLLGFGMREGERFYVLPFMDVYYLRNKGVSYSMLEMDSARGQLVLSLFAVLTVLAMWIWLARAGTGKLMAWSLGLIMGGAIGNAIDRLLVGGVIDYVSLHAFGFYWYVFNIADVAIVAGVLGLLYESFVASRNAAANGG